MEGEDKDKNLDEIVARSNLVPTAGEFIPKSQISQDSRELTDHEESRVPTSGERPREKLDDFDQVAGSNSYDSGYCRGNNDFDIAGGSSDADLRLTGHRDARESEGSENFQDGPHSSNWGMHTESGGGGYAPEGSGRRRPGSFWANKDSRYSKCSNSKGGDKWSKKLLNHTDERHNPEEGLLVRGDESRFRSSDVNGMMTSGPSGKYPPSRHRQKQGVDDKFPSHVRSYIRNGTTYYKNQGWASIPQPSGSSSLDDDPTTALYYREYKFRNLGARSGDPFENSTGNDEDSFGKRRTHGSYGKLGSKGKREEELNKKGEGSNGKAGSLSKRKDDSRVGKDKTNKTNQRERLIDLLTRGILECLVCCEQVHQNASVWSCSNCYHVLHLRCIIKWAKSSKSDFGWRCPACQNVTRQVPFGYFCFCGKVRDPEWNRSDCPHSCGEVCGKTQKKSCSHKCILLCHPGPCPQCTATVVKYCGCKKTQISVQCFSSDAVTCGTVCGNLLNCKAHTCQNICHMETCADCKEYIHQVCFCGKETRDVPCTAESAGVEKYSCEKICGRKLSCGSHICDSICHEGECKKCDLLPEVVKFCPCGQTEISSLGAAERTSCEDPIPTCSLICGKDLFCGQPGNRHTCQSTCHEGPCPACPLETVVKCRCGHMDKMLPCSELLVRADDARCSKRCIKKRSCGKHKCNQTCCIDIDHICPLPCNRMLQCSLHRCEETCHRGHCRPCWRASFEELYCECGAEVIYPPVPCGTRRPPCSRPCTRTHNCEHAPTHNCHSGNQCPPCTVLTKKYCHGRHELRKAVPCHQDTFSCGLPCNKELSCGRHKCILPCHDGSCLKEGQICTQPCKNPRSVCNHACGAPCHEGPCPTDMPCKEMVKVTCECGHRYMTRACHDNAKEYHRIATAELASKMADLQAGQTIDLDELIMDSKKMSYKTLECNDECRLIERNRRLAIALQIRNPDLSAKLTPRYSEFMRHWAKKDARFCQMVHDKLTDLVQLAKQSKQKSRSFSFDPMNREKRQFVHEYCEHFGCKSMAYDPEPKRNVVATALRDKSWLPCLSLLEVIQRESWPRKVPAPVNVRMTALPKTSQKTMEVLPSRSSKNQSPANSDNNNATAAATATTANATPASQSSEIDYFDWQPTAS